MELMFNILIAVFLWLAPFIIVYLACLFINWGDRWYPGDWEESTRLGTVVGMFIWTIILFAMIAP